MTYDNHKYCIDYDPFGMQMPARSFTGAFGYKFGFGNQEKENDISGIDGGHLIYKYRIHDARLGRFLSVDPLAKEYPWNSSYAFAENRVIQGIDLEGLEFLDANGKPTTTNPMLKLSTADQAHYDALELTNEIHQNVGGDNYNTSQRIFNEAFKTNPKEAYKTQRSPSRYLVGEQNNRSITPPTKISPALHNVIINDIINEGAKAIGELKKVSDGKLMKALINNDKKYNYSVNKDTKNTPSVDNALNKTAQQAFSKASHPKTGLHSTDKSPLTSTTTTQDGLEAHTIQMLTPNQTGEGNVWRQKPFETANGKEASIVSK